MVSGRGAVAKISEWISPPPLRGFRPEEFDSRIYRPFVNLIFTPIPSLAEFRIEPLPKVAAKVFYLDYESHEGAH